MNAQQIKLVKESWGFIIVKPEEAGQLFYARLFETAPELRHLFHGNIKEQARKLMSMVTLIVSKLEKLDTIIHEIKSLAVRHNKYGARREHYSAVGDSLMWTLKSGLGDRWTTDTETAWLLVFKILSEAMIENQQAAVASTK